MLPTFFVAMINNVALLLAMGLVYGNLAIILRSRQLPGQLFCGFFLGVIGIALMMNPLQITSGLIVDTRSILLSVGGLFLGLIPTAVASIMTCLYRFYLGGIGALTGSAVIITSGLLGYAWARLRQQSAHHFSNWEYYLFGIIVHISMLLWIFSLPYPINITVLKTISLHVMLIFPVGTLLFAKFIAGQEQREENKEKLYKSEQRFLTLSNTSPLAIYLTSGLGQEARYVNPTFVQMFGYEIADVPTVEHWWPLAYPDESYRREISKEWQRRTADAIVTGTEIAPMETVVTCKDGSRKDILWRFKTVGGENWAFGLDLTARKRAEGELARKNALLEAQLNSSIDGILIVDENGKTIVQNQLYCDMWNLPLDLAKSCDDKQKIEYIKQQAKDPEQFAAKILYLYKHPTETSRDEIELADGTFFDRYSAPVIGKNGERFGRIWYFRDITKDRQAQAKDMEQMNELMRWNRAMACRENRLLEMKEEVNELLARLGEPSRYGNTTRKEVGK